MKVGSISYEKTVGSDFHVELAFCANLHRIPFATQQLSNLDR